MTYWHSCRYGWVTPSRCSSLITWSSVSRTEARTRYNCISKRSYFGVWAKQKTIFPGRNHCVWQVNSLMAETEGSIRRRHLTRWFLCRRGRWQATGSRCPDRARGGESQGLRSNYVEARRTGQGRVPCLRESSGCDDRSRRWVRVIVVHQEYRRFGGGGGPPLRRGRGVVKTNGGSRR